MATLSNSTSLSIRREREAEGAQRLKDLAGYQINEALVRRTKPGALVMHCLPAYRGKEITEETLEAHADTIFREAVKDSSARATCAGEAPVGRWSRW